MAEYVHRNIFPKPCLSKWNHPGANEACDDKKISQRHKDTEMKENEIGTIVVDCAVKLHRDLGPGLLETVYEATLARALERSGMSVQRQVGVSIEYLGEKFDEGFRADLIVEGTVIVELKSVERVTPAHKKQLLTYLRLTGLRACEISGEGFARECIGLTSKADARAHPRCGL